MKKIALNRTITLITLVLIILPLFTTMTNNSYAWIGSIKYNFEGDTIGSNPTGSDLTIFEPGDCGYVEVNTIAGRKCAKIAKTGGLNRVHLKDKMGDENYSSGEIHFWAYHDYSAFATVITSEKDNIIIDMIWWDGMIKYREGDGYYDIVEQPIDKWVEIVVYFDLSKDGWMFDMDGIRYGGQYEFPYRGSFSGKASNCLFASFFSGGGNGDFYVDDIGYNLTNEPSIPGFNVGLFLLAVFGLTIVILFKKKNSIK